MIDRELLLATARLEFWDARDQGLPGDMAAVSIIAAIEPLIRADEREACIAIVEASRAELVDDEALPEVIDEFDVLLSILRDEDGGP